MSCIAGQGRVYYGVPALPASPSCTAARTHSYLPTRESQAEEMTTLHDPADSDTITYRMRYVYYYYVELYACAYSFTRMR